jgi:hypothetical protein
MVRRKRQDALQHKSCIAAHHFVCMSLILLSHFSNCDRVSTEAIVFFYFSIFYFNKNIRVQGKVKIRVDTMTTLSQLEKYGIINREKEENYARTSQRVV